MYNKKQLESKLNQFNQTHLLRFWDELSDEQKSKFAKQIESIDFELMKKLKKQYIDAKQTAFSGHLEPAHIIPVPSDDKEKEQAAQAKNIGEKILKAGKVVAVLVAGGQGTRLGFSGAKGKFPAGPVSGKSLFHMHADKIHALNEKYHTAIPWYIMTSETNNQETIDYFESNSYFGLNPNDVRFFVQGMLPAMDADGRFFLDKKNHIFQNPNGHGGTIAALRDNGCIDDMNKRGIEEIFYFQIDNVLIKICDPVFIGYHHLNHADMSAKVVSKSDPYEKVGVVGKLDGKITVIEYSDLPDSAKKTRDKNGKLKYSGGSVAIHTIRLDFIEKLANGKFKLPYHVAHKKIEHLDEKGDLIEPKKPNGFKLEMFIFDALPFAKNCTIMEAVREDEFSPIKNATGDDSPKTAKRDLVNYYGRMLQDAGVDVPFDENGNVQGTIEVNPLFAMDAEELQTKLEPNFQFKDNLYLE